MSEPFSYCLFGAIIVKTNLQYCVYSNKTREQPLCLKFTLWSLHSQYFLTFTLGSEVGKANGLSILLDAETFDYTYHLRAGEGFKLSVHHHLVTPSK